MDKLVNQLEDIILEYAKLLRSVSQTDFALKPSPVRWSKKEELGHLIDSAQNNIRRFIEAQYQIEPPTIVYNQDEWVKLNNYQNWKDNELIDLWISMNLQICYILKAMPVSKYNNTCNRREPHTLQWLAEDYIQHLLYHLHRVLELDPLSYP